MNNNEQPEDLFVWASEHERENPIQEPKKDDGLGWSCAQCEINGGWCSRHPRLEKPAQTDEESQEPVSDSECDDFFRELHERLVS